MGHGQRCRPCQDLWSEEGDDGPDWRWETLEGDGGPDTSPSVIFPVSSSGTKFQEEKLNDHCGGTRSVGCGFEVKGVDDVLVLSWVNDYY